MAIKKFLPGRACYSADTCDSPTVTQGFPAFAVLLRGLSKLHSSRAKEFSDE
jgi:hypothetical protein